MNRQNKKKLRKVYKELKKATDEQIEKIFNALLKILTT